MATTSHPKPYKYSPRHLSSSSSSTASKLQLTRSSTLKQKETPFSLLQPKMSTTMSTSPPLSASFHHSPILPATSLRRRRSPLRTIRVSSKKRDNYGSDHGGGLVDENMIVLRKRIREMKMAERNYEPPVEWASWEKKNFTSYQRHVCDVVGLMQLFLINVRPTIGVAVMVLFLFSVPTSMILIALHLINASISVFSASH